MAAKGFAIKGMPLGLARDVALPVAAITAAVALPFYGLMYAFIIVGQAHFVLAALYQWRGKRMNSLYLSVALMLLVGFTAYFVLYGEALPLMVTISLLFSFHFALDELTLHDEGMTKGRAISIAGFTISFFLLSVLYLYPGMVSLTIAAVTVALGAILLRFLVEPGRPARGELYIWFVQALLFATAIYFNLPGQVLAMIVIIHVINWYIAYGVRLAPSPERARTYWREVMLSLAATVALFFAFVKFDIGMLAILFGLGPYYAWAIAHILLSFVTMLPHRA